MCITFSAPTVLGQGAQTGIISGTVRSTDELPLPGATVTATSPDLQGPLTVVTDGNGVYFLRGLTPGSYRVEIEMPGFQSAVRTDVQIRVGGVADVDAVLPVAAITETVTVTAKAPAPAANPGAAQTYKKAHRHGPGFVIVIPAGEGFSVMWPEGHEKVVIPWQEASVFVPPNRWFHQHFNLGSAPARYLALHPPRGLSGTGERVQDPERDTIQYPDEEPWIRAKFEEELAKRGMASGMPAEAYRDRNYEWAYGSE